MKKFLLIGCGGGGEGDDGFESTAWEPSPGIFYLDQWLHYHTDFDLRDRSTWMIPEVIEACQNGQDQEITGNQVLHDYNTFLCHYVLEKNEPLVFKFSTAHNKPGYVWGLCAPVWKIDYYFSKLDFRGFPENPVIYLAEGTNELQELIVYFATGYINASLSPNRQLRVSRERVQALQGEPPAGDIYIDFTKRENWVDASSYTTDRQVRAITRHYDDSSHIWVHPTFTVESERKSATALLIHELLHAIGFHSHLDSVASIMWKSAPWAGDDNPELAGYLFETDRAVLDMLDSGLWWDVPPTEEEIADWFSPPRWNCE